MPAKKQIADKKKLSDAVSKRFVSESIRLMEQFKLPKYKYGESLDLAPSNINLIFSGARNPSIGNLCLMIEIYGTSPAYIFGVDEKEESLRANIAALKRIASNLDEIDRSISTSKKVKQKVKHLPQ